MPSTSLLWSGFLLLPLGALYAGASPVNSTRTVVSVKTRQDLPSLTSTQISSFKPYTFYASAAACDPAVVQTWTCGANCNANPSFVPIATGGNGATVQYWFVGWDPMLETVIVGHQGTDSDKIIPILTDINIVLESLDSTLFPGLSSDIKVHAGFKESQADTAQDVLSNVEQAISTYGATKVTVIGHSLGAGIALLDAVYLPLHLPSSITVDYIGYGTPRVGNPEFADYVDSTIASAARVTNKNDPVPILPGRFLGYAHVSGEKHINEDLAWIACPGQDNENVECSTGDVQNIFEGNPDDHSGPYDGVVMGC